MFPKVYCVNFYIGYTVTGFKLYIRGDIGLIIEWAKYMWH